MKIIWDNDKNQKLIDERGVSFEEVAALIYDGKYVDVLQNPTRQNQKIFIVPYKGYTYAVPFVRDEENDCIVLKTLYPSRKHHRLYSKNETSKTN
jgi:uncharacterized DUF497 family protein